LEGTKTGAAKVSGAPPPHGIINIHCI
jgi:hypothetical protein